MPIGSGWTITAVGEGSISLSGGFYKVSGARLVLGGTGATTTPATSPSPTVTIAPTGTASPTGGATPTAGSSCIGERTCDVDVWLGEFSGQAGWGSVGRNNWRTDVTCDGRVNLLDYEYIRSSRGFCEPPPLP
jgi:hypothetical protein